MAIAQTLAQLPRARARHRCGCVDAVALVDRARAGPPRRCTTTWATCPGLPELVDAHRHDELDPDEVRRCCSASGSVATTCCSECADPETRSDAALHRSPPAIDALRRSYDVVVIEHDPDLDGEDETGSIDVEELHGLARRATALADLVVAVGRPGMWGLHRHVRLLEELDDAGLDPRRVQPVVNHAPPTPGQRALHTRTLARLDRARRARLRGDRCSSPTIDSVADRLRSAEPLPQRWSRPLARSLPALLAELADLDLPGRPHRAAGARLVPGELGTDPVRPPEVA